MSETCKDYLQNPRKGESTIKRCLVFTYWRKAFSGCQWPCRRRNPKVDVGHIDRTTLNFGLLFICVTYITANLLNTLLHFYKSFQVRLLSETDWIETIFVGISFNRNEHFFEIAKVFHCNNSPPLLVLLLILIVSIKARFTLIWF